MFELQTTARTIGLFQDNYSVAWKTNSGTHLAREKTPRSQEKFPSDARKIIITPWASSNTCSYSHYRGKTSPVEGENSLDAGKNTVVFKIVEKRDRYTGLRARTKNNARR